MLVVVFSFDLFEVFCFLLSFLKLLVSLLLLSFELLSTILGRYSKVKRAYDINQLRQIAIKIIDCNKIPRDFKEKFLPRELSNWPKLKHQNIITMFDCIPSNQKIYMILEYANGGDMLTYIKNIKGPVPEKKAHLR